MFRAQEEVLLAQSNVLRAQQDVPLALGVGFGQRVLERLARGALGAMCNPKP